MNTVEKDAWCFRLLEYCCRMTDRPRDAAIAAEQATSTVGPGSSAKGPGVAVAGKLPTTKTAGVGAAPGSVELVFQLAMHLGFEPVDWKAASLMAARLAGKFLDDPLLLMLSSEP